MSTMVLEILLLSEPRLDDAEIGFPDDAPATFLTSFPLDKDLCQITCSHVSEIFFDTKQAGIQHIACLQILQH